MKLGNRPLRFALFATIVAALGSSAYFAKSAGAEKVEAARAAATAQSRADGASAALRHAEQRNKWVSAATQLVADSQQAGLTPERWVERKVNLRSASVSRIEADRLVRETAASTGRLFVAEGFELSVLGAKEGLFDVPSSDDRGLVMTLAGSYFARDARENASNESSLPPS
jgi:hypothetical protein